MPSISANTKASSVKDHALFLSFDRALDRCPAFKAGGAGVVVLVTPPEQQASDYKIAAGKFLYEGLDRDSYERVGYCCITRTDKPQKMRQEFLESCQKRERAIVISETTALPPDVVVAVDTFVHLDPMQAEDLREACRKVLGLKLSLDQARRILAFPQSLVFVAIRHGRTPAEILKRLNAVAPANPNISPIAEAVPRLEDLHGYGAAKDWGLQLAQDLRAWEAGTLGWSEIDRGLLLSGPPGVGKTIFARALAETCGVHFVATSVVQWQATGHLGDLLKAMRGDFSAAVSKAPAIILLDELDSVGDRQTFTGEYATYARQVVNALLECLDGAGQRDGVVVIGATNFPDKIDAAIRRPGRLDRHVAIGLPNVDERVAILSQLLGDHSIPDLRAIGPLTESMAGADLARLVRDAKKKARRAQRPIAFEDLSSQLPDLIKITGAFRRTIAVHEAGHALVGLAVGYGRFAGVTILNQLNPRLALQAAGGANFDLPILALRTAGDYRNDICVRLGGIAAEQLVFGSHSDGAGLGATSDLAVATALALQMETKTAMGARLHQFGAGTPWDAFGSHSPPWLMDRVEKTLREELSRAAGIVSEQRPLLMAVANVLDEKGSVLPDRIEQLRADLKIGVADKARRSRKREAPDAVMTAGDGRSQHVSEEVRR